MLTNPRDAFRGRSVKVTKHSIIPYVKYSFLLCNSNFVRASYFSPFIVLLSYTVYVAYGLHELNKTY